MTTGDNLGCWYMSRPLDLPPLVAQAAYDAQRFDAGVRVRSRAPRGWLAVRGWARTSNGRGYRPYRAQPALIVASLWVWPVQLELLPWSSERTELGLRPMRGGVRGAPPQPVTAVGCEVLTRLAAHLREWADAPLRALVGQRPHADPVSGCSGPCCATSPARRRRVGDDA